MVPVKQILRIILATSTSALIRLKNIWTSTKIGYEIKFSLYTILYKYSYGTV